MELYFVIIFVVLNLSENKIRLIQYNVAYMAGDNTSLSYLFAAEYLCGHYKQSDNTATALNVLMLEELI